MRLNDDSRAVRALRAIGQRELAWCVRLNRHIERPWLRHLMATASRLGDGWVWAALIGLTLLRGDQQVAIRMIFAGCATTLVYKLIKAILGRRRPCELSGDLDLPIPPLDRWSFPSGHTMHAVSFSAIAFAYYPQMAVVLVPFTGLVMMSRVLLGLHYPSDVMAGLACGYLIATLSVSLPL